jgi:hypothetical protein
MVINKRVVVGAIVFAVVVVVYGILLLNGIAYQKATINQPTAYLTILAPGLIPTQDLSLLVATPTATLNPSFGDLKGIHLNIYVQISGTSGAGLKIREEPGLKNNMKYFLASESEAFQVIDGPVSQDGLIWWKLVTPYDQKRQGWAAADYLSLIEGQ